MSNLTSLTEADLKLLRDIQMHTSLWADLIVETIIKKERLESMALTLGSIHNSLRSAAGRAKHALDMAGYLEKQHVPHP